MREATPHNASRPPLGGRTVLRIVVGAVTAAGLSAAASQSPPPQDPPPVPQPTFRTEANYVRVDVFPTAGGRPVTDLRAEDFELFEDGKPQRVEAFEHVVVRPAGPQTARVEPNTQAQGNQMAADPRNRVFVLFLDTYHVENEASHHVRRPLVTMLDRVIGQDDLIGVMTPEMSAANLVLARRTTTIEAMLTQYWDWGRREDVVLDPQEQLYASCYPPTPEIGDLAQEMIERRREKQSLDAMQDLVRHLRGIREERKAILAISGGWKLFQPNQNLARALKDYPIPGTPEMWVGRGGKLRTKNERSPSTLYECDRDRLHLAQLDNARLFRDILDEANRANASFYPIDPRGLPAFDTSVGPRPPLTVVQDFRQLKARLDSLQTLAGATDGVAVVNTNDLDSGMKRVVDDLTSYYLLGYYSTNTKLDGKFRSITVRVKRPGVSVRARRGYRAATAEEVAAARTAPAPPPTKTTSAVSAAIGMLAGIRAQASFRVHAVAGWRSTGQPGATSDTATFWIVGELDERVARSEEWRAGGEAQIQVSATDGTAVAAADARIAPGTRHFLVQVPAASLTASEYSVRARVKGATGTGLPVSDTTRVVGVATGHAEATLLRQPLLFRRNPSTGTAYEPTADFRFRRHDRLRLEIPVGGAPVAGGGAENGGSVLTLSGRLLDRNGQPLDIPVVTSERRDAEGTRWIVADVTLAPLAAGDYVVEVGAADRGRQQIVVTGVRIVNSQ